MIARLNHWLTNVFSNSDINKLLLVIFTVSCTLWLFIEELAPLLGAILIAYVLEGAVKKLEHRFNSSRAWAVAIVIFVTLLVFIISLYALPKFLLELRQLGDKLPETSQIMIVMVDKINAALPLEIALDQASIATQVTELTGSLATYVINNLFSYAGNIFSLFLYLILLPLLVFFLLRDKNSLLRYMSQFMPDSNIFSELWEQINEQFGSYIRGKIIEAAMVGAATGIMLLLFNMQNVLALSILVALSVFIPFVGAIAVTFPVVLFAYLQFGWSSTFFWIVLLYTIIQTIDAQILVPLLFSEVVRIHPVALFSSLIFFGSLWGIIGVFFAIPLASLIKCTIAIIIKRRAVPPPLPL